MPVNNKHQTEMFSSNYLHNNQIYQTVDLNC